MRRVPSIRESTASFKLRSASSETAVTVRRTGSRREESPGLASRQRLGLRTASPNTSNVSLKGAANKRLGRSDSLRTNKSNPLSRSSSFNRSESKPSVARPGLATLPREAGRSRSQPGDYVTVLEIGGSGETGTRSKSASHRPSGGRETSLNRAVSRNNSIKKGPGESSGTVSVHIKHNQDVSNSHSVDSRPAPSRKQSIKIGRVETTSTPSNKTVRTVKR